MLHGISPFVPVCLVYLVEPDKPDQPDGPQKKARLTFAGLRGQRSVGRVGQELHDLTSYTLNLRRTTSLFHPGFLTPAWNRLALLPPPKSKVEVTEEGIEINRERNARNEREKRDRRGIALSWTATRLYIWWCSQVGHFCYTSVKWAQIISGQKPRRLIPGESLLQLRSPTLMGAAENQQTLETMDRAHRTCMEAKGYQIG